MKYDKFLITIISKIKQFSLNCNIGIVFRPCYLKEREKSAWLADVRVIHVFTAFTS